MTTPIIPNLIIPGVPKSATTSLVHYLNISPEVFILYGEPKFFYNKQKYKKGPDYYSSLFKDVKKEKIIGENSNIYFYYKEVIKRIVTEIPDILFIICLRNPVDRAFSQYNYCRQNGTELFDFRTAIKFEKFRIKIPYRFFRNNYSYISRGFYYKYIKEILNYINKDKIYFCITEELHNNPQSELKKISKFLNIDDSFIQNINFSKKHNATKYPKHTIIQFFPMIYKKFIFPYKRFMVIEKLINKIENYNLTDIKPVLSQDLRKKLIEIYKPDFEKLSILIDKELSVWEKY